MTQFASKTPRDLNHDPHPYRYANGDRRVAPEVDPDDPTTRDPRPEYDHPQHNEPNPILVRLRVERSDPAGFVKSGDLSRMDIDISDATPEHIDHARRVLSRLAAPTEGTSA